MLPVTTVWSLQNRALKPKARETDDELILRLSDSFKEEHRSESDVEVRVRMLNINYGHNHKLTEACSPIIMK